MKPFFKGHLASRVFGLALCLALALTLTPTAFAAGNGIAYANTQDVAVDGEPVQFQMYALKDANGGVTNYVKLRDVAYVLNDSPSSFAVSYDEETKTIRLWTELSYSSNGSEMSTPFSGDRSYTASPTTLQIDYWTYKTLDAILLTDDNGGGYTYFKLRDLGEALGFEVDWSAERGITVETGARTLPQTAVQVPEKADEVIRLVNEARAKEGRGPLSTYPALTRAAQIRAAELTGYYSHTRPDGTKYNTVLTQAGADQMVSASGENIANGTMAQNPSGVMMVWMNSPSHRDNILNRDFTHIGVGCVYLPKNPYRFYWVQVFAGVDGTPEGNVQAEPVLFQPERTFSTDPLFALDQKEIPHMTVNGGGAIVPIVDEEWIRLHGAHTTEWSVDDPSILSLRPGSDYVPGSIGETYNALAPGEAKVTCKITGEDGYTAEAYCYVTVRSKR